MSAIFTHILHVAVQLSVVGEIPLTYWYSGTNQQK